MAFHVYFKLDNTVKHEHEAEDFARMEIESLFGKVRPVSNFISEAQRPPLSAVVSLSFNERSEYPIRLEDVLTYELPYGRIHGYYGFAPDLPDFGRLVRRLAYTREIVGLANGSHAALEPAEVWMDGMLGTNFQIAGDDNCRVFRFITNQYFVEKSEYIFRLSRNEREVIESANLLLRFPTLEIYRIPATETARVDRRLEDCFSIREETSLYITHYMHPYKGKFHPKMARALLNIVLPEDRGTVMDNFAGSGTLLVEAAVMGIPSIGVEINPLSVLMSSVKTECLKVPAPSLKLAIEGYLALLSSAILQYGNVGSARPEVDPIVDFAEVRRLVDAVPQRVARCFPRSQETLENIAVARLVLEKCTDPSVKAFLQLSLSGTISDILRRTRESFVEVLGGRLADLHSLVLLFQELRSKLRIPVADASCVLGDARDMSAIATGSIDAIVCSPPYSTALDYVRNDEPQLRLLGLADDLARIEDAMIGNPREHGAKCIGQYDGGGVFNDGGLPLYATNVVKALDERGRPDAAARCLRFFQDMARTLQEMHRVLKVGALAAVVIGNNHFQIGKTTVEIRNDDILRRLAERNGFETLNVVRRELEKSSSGMIRYESVLFLKTVP